MPPSTCSPDPAGPPAPQERPTHLLLIAIDQYPRVGKLSNAVRDAEAFAEAFQTHYPLAGIERLTDAEAPREKIFRKVLDLGRGLPPGSNLIL